MSWHSVNLRLFGTIFPPSVKHPSTRLGIGDDCALLAIPQGYELAMTTDTMVEQVHFFRELILSRSDINCWRSI